MKHIIIVQDDRLTLQELDDAGKPVREVAGLLRAGEVARQLKVTRRQLYRYTLTGRLKPAARLLGELLFEPGAVARFTRPRRGRGAQLPPWLAPLLWSYRLSDLDPVRDADTILGAALERGGWRAFRWVWRFYGRERMRLFLAERGFRRLSPQARAFWCLVLDVPKKNLARPPFPTNLQLWPPQSHERLAA